MISAPSGAGKSTIGKELLSRDRDLRCSISCTTRAPRPGERDGRDYHFSNKARFQKGVRDGQFIEWARVHNHFYGTPRSGVERVLESGKDALLVIDTQGAASLRRLYPETLSIFVTAPTWTELVNRLKKRGISKNDLAVRLKSARRELQEIRFYDHAVINDRLDHAVGQIVKIIRAERRRRRGH